MLARKMSPVEIAGMPRRTAIRAAWVPLPAPGGPRMIRRMSSPSRRSERSSRVPRSAWACLPGVSSTEEPFVVPLLELGLDLLHRLQADADDDEDRGATEREVLVGVDQFESNERNERDQCEIDRTGHSDPGEDVLKVLGGGSTGADTRDEAAVALHVVGHLGGVEGDR